MQELFDAMSTDMNISAYWNETTENYAYRVLYSALGLWCLKIAQVNPYNWNGVSKNAQTAALHDLNEKYMDLYPGVQGFFSRKKSSDVAVFIRVAYEQTGYLCSTKNNCNLLAKKGRSILLSEKQRLYFGIPRGQLSMNGLGVFTDCEGSATEKLQDFLIRDRLSTDEYVRVNFNSLDFEAREIDQTMLEFFDPKMRISPSRAWKNHMDVEFTIARQGIAGPYYRVIKKDGGDLLFADEREVDKKDSFTGYEYRRLYMALNEYYGNPMMAYLCQIDEMYSHIRFLGHLPNREYYLMLMCGWPKFGIEDKTNFIIKNEFLNALLPVLKNIGVNVKEGKFRG